MCDELSVHSWLVGKATVCADVLFPHAWSPGATFGMTHESFNKKSILKFKILNYEPEVQNQGNHLFINNMLIHEKIQLKSP